MFTGTTPDRGGLVPLDRAVVRGKVYISAGGDGATVKSVTFRLDNPLASELRTEYAFPYDFAGGAEDGSANAFDTTTVPDGPHVVLADVELRDGTRANIFARFTVANKGAVPEPTKPVTPSPTPTTPTPTKPPVNNPPPPPAGGGRCVSFPTPSCTGVPGDTKLTTVNGDYAATRAGEVIDGKRITGKVSVRAKGVVIRNSEILGGVNNFTGKGSFPYTIEDSTVGPESGCMGDFAIGAENFTARRVEIRNASDGFRSSGDDILIQDSFAKVCTHSSNHSDGIQGNYSGNNVVIRHNTIDQRGVQNATSPLFFADQSAGATVQNNLFMGGGYTVRMYGSGYVFTGNMVVNRSWGYGPAHNDCRGIQWSDNKIVEMDQSYKVTGTVSELGCK